MNLFSYLQFASIVRNIKNETEEGRANELVKKIINYLNYVEKATNPPERVEGVERIKLEEMGRHCAEICTWYSRNGKLLEEAEKRLAELKRGLEKAGYETMYIDAQLEERGVFGVSQRFGEFLFKVGLEFDPYLNLPTIPGSSLKGAAKSVYKMLKENNKDWPFPEEIFGLGGETGQVGKAIFLDGYPIRPGRGGAILFPDVMTPHYKKKSGEDEFREFDWDPRPITYLSVAPGTTFRFIIGVKDKKHKEILQKTLVETFDLGVGAKTSVGYGRFVTVGEDVG